MPDETKLSPREEAIRARQAAGLDRQQAEEVQDRQDAEDAANAPKAKRGQPRTESGNAE